MCGLWWKNASVFASIQRMLTRACRSINPAHPMQQKYMSWNARMQLFFWPIPTGSNRSSSLHPKPTYHSRIEVGSSQFNRRIIAGLEGWPKLSWNEDKLVLEQDMANIICKFSWEHHQIIPWLANDKALMHKSCRPRGRPQFQHLVGMISWFLGISSNHPAPNRLFRQ